MLLQDSPVAAEAPPSSQVAHEVQGNRPNPAGASEAPAADSGSLSVASSDNRKISREDIELVRFKSFLIFLIFPFLKENSSLVFQNLRCQI
jgi:hypothetical protein